MSVDLTTEGYLDLLSRLLFQGHTEGFEAPAAHLQAIYPDVALLAGLPESTLAEFVDIASKHHVMVRTLKVIRCAAEQLGEKRLGDWCENTLQTEGERISHAISLLGPICYALEAAACHITVIKSLDHMPDLGSDLDLYTTGDAETVVEVMGRDFNAQTEPRSWGDRLAGKWNFSIPGLPELIEIHVRYLGQTGEHQAMARRVISRSTVKLLDGHAFRVPAPEEQVVISTLQRMYRHFYFRLCDMADMAALLQSGAIDFKELRRAAETGGIWPGVATFLLLVSKYVKGYGGKAPVPPEVIADAQSSEIAVHPRGDFLRVPMAPAASLYGSQLLTAGRKFDLRALTRLPLLPPLAVSALVAYRITGSDKGIW